VPTSAPQRLSPEEVAIDPEYFQVVRDSQKQWWNEHPDYPETAPPRFCPLQSVRCLAEAIMTIAFSLGTPLPS